MTGRGNASRHHHFISILLAAAGILFAVSSDAGSQGSVILFFAAGSCDSKEADPWDQSTLGVKSVEWSDEAAMNVRAFVSLNCASHIARGDFEIAGDTIILKYIWSNPTRGGREMITHCLCAQELNYALKRIAKKDYRFRLESIKDMSYSPER